MTPRLIFLAIFVQFVWGMNYVPGWVAIQEIPPLLAVSFRLLGTALILCWRFRIGKKQRLQIFKISFFYTTIGFGLFFVGFKNLDVSLGAILAQLGIPFSVLLAAIFFKDSLDRRSWFALILAFLGVVFISGQPESFKGFWAIAVVLFAQLGWAIGTLQIKKCDKIHPLAIIGWSYLYALPQVLMLSLIFEFEQYNSIYSASSLAWICIGITIILGSVIGYGLWAYLLQKCKISSLLPFHLLDPVFAILAGSILLNEQLSIHATIGALLIVSGVGIITVNEKARDAT